MGMNVFFSNVATAVTTDKTVSGGAHSSRSLIEVIQSETLVIAFQSTGQQVWAGEDCREDEGIRHQWSGHCWRL